MPNAIILHGKPSKERYYDPVFPASSNYYWIPWLQKQLIIRDIFTATPEVPNNWQADYPTWQKEVERYEVNSETLLIGHSCGAGFLLRWLSEHHEMLPAKVVLAAPWLNPNKHVETGDFFKFDLDKSLAERTKMSVLYSEDDEASVLQTVEILRKTYPKAKFKELYGMGHFYDDRHMEFQDLLEELVN